MTVYPFSAPSRAYGTPDDLRRPGQQRPPAGLTVLLDVVDTPFGSRWHYMGSFPITISTQRITPLGAAI